MTTVTTQIRTIYGTRIRQLITERNIYGPMLEEWIEMLIGCLHFQLIISPLYSLLEELNYNVHQINLDIFTEGRRRLSK